MNKMNNRRDFLKTAATGAVLLGSQSKLGLAAMLDQPGQHAAGASKVVVARDPQLHGSDGQLDEKRVQALLDRAIHSYTGIERPAEAWKHIVPAGKTIGLKVNGLGGKGISSHLALVLAICERLQQAGVKPGNIIVWDRNARDIEACGLTINTDPAKIRVFGSDVSGYEDQQSSFGSARIKLSKILTHECEMVIGVPILKDHSGAGVTFAMKNMYGVVDRPQDLHAGGCNPGVADLNCIQTVREKVRFTIGDAMSSVYNGGPGFRPEFLWHPNALIVGEDRVAIDHTAWQIIEKQRAEKGMPTLEAAGRPPRYITTAADATHQLGTNDPNRIHLLEV
jgi:uncharacterized protein (DUF362 family)